ncbi:MAG: long chain acyl-CoA synthetase, partial [Chloroflexi bacterium]
MIPPRLLTDGLLRSATAFPDKAALIDSEGTCTYGQLQDSALRLAGFLADQGLQRGDRVAIYLDNSWLCAAAIYGVLLAGGVFVVINPQTKSAKLRYILTDCQAMALITDQHLAIQYETAVKDLADLLVVLSAGIETPPDTESNLVELRAVLKTSRQQKLTAKVIATDLAALIYTSGSTGEPKGVMQTHQSMVFAAWSIIEYLEMSAEDRILVVLPMAFDYGLYQLLMSIFVGATLVIERSFAFPGRVYEVMRNAGITVVPGVPTVFATMRSSHLKSPLSFPDVRIITNTAAALAPALLPALGEIFPNARIFKMYGLTECKRVAYLKPDLLATDPDSVGIAIPGTEVSLHTLSGEIAAPGEPGILHVRGPHVMVGYWNQPELTAHMLREGPVPGERVLVTHDWFSQDENGLLRFVGRSDDIIKTRGEKVSPIEVENLLCNMDGILQAAVIGVPDEQLGEQIKAFVVADQGAQLTTNSVRRFCSLHLENFMV